MHPSTGEARVSTIHLRALLEAVETLGIPAQRFAQEASVDLSLASDPYGQVSVNELDRLTELAIETTHEPAFGLRWGDGSPMFGFDIMTLLFQHAPTMRAALKALIRCQSILGPHPEVSLSEDVDAVYIRFDPMSRRERVRRARCELAFSGVARMLRTFRKSEEGLILRVEFAYARPAYASEYERIFGANMCRFGRPASCIALDRAVIDAPLNTANLELHQLVIAQAERVLVRVEAACSFAERIRAQIRMHLPRALTMAELAHRLGTSERSLRRRLAEEGILFHQLAQQELRQHAELLLADRSRTIQDVASCTGFASVTAFHRAFRRWTGMSASEFRAFAVGQQHASRAL